MRDSTAAAADGNCHHHLFFPLLLVFQMVGFRVSVIFLVWMEGISGIFFRYFLLVMNWWERGWKKAGKERDG